MSPCGRRRTCPSGQGAFPIGDGNPSQGEIDKLRFIGEKSIVFHFVIGYDIITHRKELIP